MQTGMVMTFGCKKKKIKEVQEEDKSTKMLRLQQEMMLLQQEMDKESKEQLNDSSKTNNSDVLYQPIQRMQDPTGVLKAIEDGEITLEEATKEGVMEVKVIPENVQQQHSEGESGIPSAMEPTPTIENMVPNTITNTEPTNE